MKKKYLPWADDKLHRLLISFLRHVYDPCLLHACPRLTTALLQWWWPAYRLPPWSSKVALGSASQLCNVLANFHAWTSQTRESRRGLLRTSTADLPTQSVGENGMLITVEIVEEATEKGRGTFASNWCFFNRCFVRWRVSTPSDLT